MHSIIFFIAFIIHTLHPVSASYFYYDGHGFANNSCRVRACASCGVGNYRYNCSGTDPGYCMECSNKPANSNYTSDSAYSYLCPFDCNPDYYLNGSVCLNLYIYRIPFSFTFVDSIDNYTLNLPKIIGVFANLSSCGSCDGVPNGPVTSPVKCTSCIILFNVSSIRQIGNGSVIRRLLQSSSVTYGSIDVNMNIQAQNGANQANAAVAAMNNETVRRYFQEQSLPDLTFSSTPTVLVTRTVPIPIPIPTTTVNNPVPVAPTSSDSGSSSSLYIGLGVGGGIFIIAAAGIGVYFGLKPTTQVVPPPTTKAASRFNIYPNNPTAHLSSSFVFPSQEQGIAPQFFMRQHNTMQNTFYSAQDSNYLDYGPVTPFYGLHCPNYCLNYYRPNTQPLQRAPVQLYYKK